MTWNKKPGLSVGFLSRLPDRFRANEHLFDICIAMLIGCLCGLGAVAFRYLIHFCHFLFWGSGEVSVAFLQGQPWWRLLFMPAIGGLVVGPIIYFFAREAKGHGVPEVMAAVALRNGVIRIRVALAKALASAVTISSGGSAGSEGPIIQIGSAIGSWVGQLLRVSSRKLRTYVGCGAAAGIAATFNAPIAGALFSVEVILGEFGVSQFGPIVIASVLATAIARHHFGGGPVFEVGHYEVGSGEQILPYIVLGILCGVLAYVYIKTLYFAEDTSDQLKKVHPVFKPMIGGLLLGVMGILIPQVYGDGYETINEALHSGLPLAMLVTLLLAKVLATSFTLGSGGSGGVFAPSLFMGAMLGGTVGHFAGTLIGASAGETGLYALVAMGGLVAGATHAPISAILIIFEITYDYEIILPLMVVCILSTVVCRLLSGESIYSMKLARRGIDLFRRRSLDLLKGVKVGEVLHKEVETFPLHERVTVLMDRMAHSEHEQFYLVDEQQKLQGVVTMEALRRVLMNREGLEHLLLAEDVADERVQTCTVDENLSQALLKFEQAGLAELPVVQSMEDYTLAGTLRYNDLLSMYSSELMKEESAEGVVQRMKSSRPLEKVRLVKGFSVIEWDPPSALWGKSLRDAGLPARYNIRVLLVKRRDPEKDRSEVVPEIPGPNYSITEKDTLIVYGPDADIERVGRL